MSEVCVLELPFDLLCSLTPPPPFPELLFSAMPVMHGGVGVGGRAGGRVGGRAGGRAGGVGVVSLSDTDC